MVSSPIVLDNGVLSSFLVADWFENLDFVCPEKELVATKLVWEEEFEPHNTVSEVPSWMSVRNPTERIHSNVPGKLSNPDWSCVALAEEEEGTVITNDEPLKQTCHDRDIDVRWGTKFMIRVFKECGISQEEYEAGVPAYIDDVYLPPSVEDEVARQSK